MYCKMEGKMIFVFLYLAAILTANLIVTQFGPSASIYTAFLFIGLDLTTRDKLHDFWQDNKLFPKMAALIVSGSVLSYLLNSNSATIAVASCVAFLVSGAIDFVIYHYLSDQGKWVQVNGSNIPAALADSMIFPYLAFGGFMPQIVIGQFVAKVFGGMLWLFIIQKAQSKQQSFTRSVYVAERSEL